MFGETIALVVAVSWTAGALAGELASKRLGALPLNVIRMALSLLLLGTALFFVTGRPYPLLADGPTWLWMGLSGLVGFGFGDYCLFNSYVLIGSRFSQLFMTLASPFAALAALVLLGERMSPLAVLGMGITVVGIGMSILGKEHTEAPKGEHGRVVHLSVKLPLKGFLFGIGASLGQGVGLVLSKVGLERYAEAAAGAGVNPLLFPVGGTMIRTLAGLFCFLSLLMLRGEWGRLHRAVHDGRGMRHAFVATLLGPAVGVSLSLLALQYTEAGVAQTLMSLVPVLIIWPSHVLFGTKVTATEVVGAVIAVAGVTLFFV